MKKLLSTFLVGTMILGGVIVPCEADSLSNVGVGDPVEYDFPKYTEGDFEITVVSREPEYGVISKYTGSDTEVTLPGEVAGYNVVSLSAEALPDYVDTLTIPTVTNFDWENLYTVDSCPFVKIVNIHGVDGGKLNLYGFDSATTMNIFGNGTFEVSSFPALESLNFSCDEVELYLNSCENLTSFDLSGRQAGLTLQSCPGLEYIYVPKTMEDFTCFLYNQSQQPMDLNTIHYEGSEAEKNQIAFLPQNDFLHDATWVYNSTIDSVPSAPQDGQPEEPTSPVHDAWATGIVSTAVENDLIVDSLGMDYTKSITREQIADLLVNMVEKASGTVLETGDEVFTDTSSEAVSKASAAGIIGGKGNGIFDPDNTATRQEIAIMIVRAIEKLEELSGESYVDHSLTTLEGYSDFADTAVWAQDFVAILANNGIMAGSNNKLTPLSATSIQECLVLNNNLFKLGE